MSAKCKLFFPRTDRLTLINVYHGQRSAIHKSVSRALRILPIVSMSLVEYCFLIDFGRGHFLQRAMIVLIINGNDMSFFIYFSYKSQNEEFFLFNV